MKVTDRLKRLTGEGGRQPGGDSAKEIISELRSRIDAIMERRDRIGKRPEARYLPSSAALEEVMTGEEITNEFGRFFFTRTRYPGSASHGRHLMRSFVCPDMASVAHLAAHGNLADLSMADGLFLDTETTGLAGGTGTFAFLIGLGWFEGDDFIVCQLFARDFPEEAAMLGFLREIAREKHFLVTFNGRAYDLNLLGTRYILNRLEDPFATMPHVDLLHPSRRLLGHRLVNSRLVTLEACVLGFERTGDVPGFEIPQRYFDWLRRRDARLMEDVFEHNRLDIISMAALVKHLSDLLAGEMLSTAHPSDIIAAARLYLERGNQDAARRFYECACNAAETSAIKDAKRALSLMHKQAGKWKEAVCIWEEMIVRDPGDVFAAEELAKYLEHRVHDYQRAIRIVEDILENAGYLSGEVRGAFEYRLARLLGKYERSVISE